MGLGQERPGRPFAHHQDARDFSQAVQAGIGSPAQLIRVALIRVGPGAAQSLNNPARSSAVIEPLDRASPSITSANSWAFRAFRAMTFSSIVSFATSR
ncbi:UNVERIFIED_ORG: hypothetical protein ABIB52_001804 [Arthrobacter sp. UYCu721]